MIMMFDLLENTKSIRKGSTHSQFSFTPRFPFASSLRDFAHCFKVNFIFVFLSFPLAFVSHFYSLLNGTSSCVGFLFNILLQNDILVTEVKLCKSFGIPLRSFFLQLRLKLNPRISMNSQRISLNFIAFMSWPAYIRQHVHGQAGKQEENESNKKSNSNNNQWTGLGGRRSRE